MSEATQLSTELNVFESIVDDLAQIAARTDPARRHELTRLRRRLSDQIGVMRIVGMTAFSDHQTADEFRSRLSTVLGVVATHQANYPAISIDDKGNGYRRSAVAAATGNRAFIEWVRAALARGG